MPACSSIPTRTRASRFSPSRGGDGLGVDGAAAVAQHAVDTAQQIGGRNVPQRETAKRRGVGVAGEKHGVARRAVPARAADHLDVALERVREVDERDEPHVGLVDPHPEGGRRDHDGRPSRDEGLLDARPLLRLEPGVVVLGTDAVTDEHSCDLLAGPPGTGVDDRGAVEPTQSAEQRPQALLAVLRALDVVAEIRSVDARAHDLERPAERLGDRHGVRRSGRRRHAQDRWLVEHVERAPDEEVVRAKVVSPHAHAVHLVDHDEPDADPAERLDEPLLPQPLRRGVEEPGLARGDRCEARRRLVLRERGVDEGRGCRDLRRELVHLILHQRDQGREDERGGRPEHRGELVRQRLAGARRHERQRVPSVHRGAHDLLLPRAEVVESEVIPQRRAKVGQDRHANECTGATGRLRA